MSIPLQAYSKDTVAEVLAANDIVEIIGSFIELRPAGSGRMVGLCPFHNEKTPSFSVNRDRQIFHCFGCGKGGDAISFLCEYETLSFTEALRKLADRGGVRLPALSERDNREDHQRQKLLELGKLAQRHFRGIYEDAMKGGKARAYVKTRQIKPEVVKRFGFGYAPEDWNLLREAAHKEGFRDDLLEASGLIRRSEKGSLYDFFRDRLMFPIRDTSGNVVAFGGRDLSGQAKGKYVNTPENPVYKKSRILYGLFEARDGLRREKKALLVEGYFDLIRCFDAGVENVVASCGTALTSEQAALIRRYVPEVVIVYDGDAAGIRAAVRGVSILTTAGLTVRALALPNGQDPDDFIKAEGGEAFRRLIEQAPDFVTFYVDMNADRIGSIEGRAEVAKELFAILQDLDDELRRDEYLRQMARRLRVDEWTLRREFRKSATQAQGRAGFVKVEPPREVPLNQDERDFVAILLGHPPLIDQVRTQLADVALKPGPLAEVLGELFSDPGPGVAQRLQSDGARTLYASAANQPLPWDDKAEALVQKRIIRFKKEAKLAESQRLSEAIREAERLDDKARVVELVTRKLQLEKEIQMLGAA